MNLTIVWGSSGAGKTAVALSLAAALAKKHEDTLVISNDSRTPALPVYLPGNTGLIGANSLGALLEQPVVSEGTLKDRIHRHPKSEHLFFMGYVSGEVMGITYRPPHREIITSLLQQLQQSPFRHVIIDGDASPIYDPMTLFALEHAQQVVRVVTPDVKGYEWQKAQLSWLRNSELFHAERHIKAANYISPTTPLAAAQSVFGGFDYELPQARQVADKVAAGDMLCNFDAPDAVRFERIITAMAGQLCPNEEMIKHA